MKLLKTCYLILRIGMYNTKEKENAMNTELKKAYEIVKKRILHSGFSRSCQEPRRYWKFVV